MMTKWWGWGNPETEFPIHEKPFLWAFVEKKLGISSSAAQSPVVSFDSFELCKPTINPQAMNALSEILKPDQISADKKDRMIFSYGKSYPDLFRARSGIFPKPPDVVVFPKTHEEVEKLIEVAKEHKIVLIPFGGGTNIVGGTEALCAPEKMVVTISMKNMNRLLEIDPVSRQARFMTGILGPELEKQLAKHGYSLGHFPDSFMYSSLGGWIATRSAGMQSDEYGKIEDLIKSLKVATPKGTITTQPFPGSSAGIDIKNLILGSEGILGVITEAVVQVHKIPAQKKYVGYLFPSFSDGYKAINECASNDTLPSMFRLQDEEETEFAFSLKPRSKFPKSWFEKGMKFYLKKAGYARPALLVVGFEGGPESVESRSRYIHKILTKHRGFSLGTGVGDSWSKNKFDVPYLRDFLMTYGVMCDVSETATSWSNVSNLYEKTRQAFHKKLESENNKGFIGCHISHSYATGCCLYFTYGVPQIKGQELKQYYGYKTAITDAIVENGGTVSHHHAVGYEHKTWLKKEIGLEGMNLLKSVKTHLDPTGIMNPGKVL